MPDPEGFSDAELLALYHEPKADLSLLNPDELQRLDHLTGEESSPPAQVRPIRVGRSGTVYTEPDPAQVSPDLRRMGSTFLQTLNPMNLVHVAEAGWEHPAETAKAVGKGIVLTPFRLAGQAIGGDFSGALGEAVGTLGQLAIPGLVSRFIPKKPEIPTLPPPETLTLPSGEAVSAADLKAAGVGDQALDILRKGRPTPTPQPIVKTAGIPPAAPSPVAAPGVPPEPATPGPVAGPEVSAIPPNAAGPPRVMTLKPTPTSWTPEAARARLEMNEWHSGAEPGTADAQQMSGLHKFDSELKSRMQYMLDNPKGYISPYLLHRMGLEGLVRPAMYGTAYKWYGWPGVAALGAVDAGQLLAQHPQGIGPTLRAMTMANLASHEPAK